VRFIDSNVFIHAILEPKRDLADHEEEIKQGAKDILQRIMAGEASVTTVVHLSEVANILESRTTMENTIQILNSITSIQSLIIEPVNPQEYRSAINYSTIKKMGINDSLALYKMKNLEIVEIYSFDKHFDNIEMKRITN
jgi:hypothetical protein